MIFLIAISWVEARCSKWGWSKNFPLQKCNATVFPNYCTRKKIQTNLQYLLCDQWPSALQIWAVLQYSGYPTVLRVATRSKSYPYYILIKSNYHKSNVINSNHITVIRKPVSPNGSHITVYSSFPTLHFLSNGSIWAAHRRWPSPQLLKHNPPPFCSLHTTQVLSLPLKY